MRRTLYVTVDGLLQPLGYSQVFRVVEGLARLGVPYSIVSMERAEDLAVEDRVRALEDRLAAVGVDWTHSTYTQGGALTAAENVTKLGSAAFSRVRRGDIGLVHARSYHGAGIALAIHTTLRTPYLFDTRSYWIDERLDGGRWFRHAPVLAAARAAERALYRNAAGIVTLTQLQADDIAGGRFGALGGRPIEVITTCADFDEFRLRERGDIAPEILDFAGDGLVLGFVGSVNVSYRSDRAARLAKRVLELRPDAKIVALGADPAAYLRLFAEAAIEPARVLARRVEHDRIASWLPGIDWGVLLLASSFSKRASMPTKLGEFFAAGVRPVHHGCNTEVASWIARTGSGITLEGLDDDQLDRAARTIATSSRDREVQARARSLAKEHFSLASAWARYRELVGSLA
ncbi:MAG: glycosyltransferase [Polyangiales bacterium]